MAISQRDGPGHVTPITRQGTGQFLAEVGQLSGSHALVDGYAEEDVECLLVPPSQLRALIIAEADLGDRSEVLPAVRGRSRRQRQIRHLFLFVRADPETRWLAGCGVRMDPDGFVLTGQAAAGPTTGYVAAPLETAVPESSPSATCVAGR